MMQEDSFTAEEEGRHVSLGLWLSFLVYVTCEGQHRANRSGNKTGKNRNTLEDLFFFCFLKCSHDHIYLNIVCNFLAEIIPDHNNFKHEIVSFSLEVVPLIV